MVGKTLLHYEIAARIGAGGMGEVFRARDTKLGRDVAVKILPAEMSDNPERLARFQREARALAALHHPNVAGIYSLETDGDVYLLVMELVEGDDLDQCLTRGPLSTSDALEFAGQIAEGMAAAHEKGIVHRDLKPANVKVTPEGTIKILDFGLARSCEDELDGLDGNSPTISAGMTQAGTILGTAAYMSPEQARGNVVDKQTDVWAFGCVLYELLAGRRCFCGESVTDILAAVVREEPDWGALPADLRLRVRELLHLTLQKDPCKRLRDMSDAGLLLERAKLDPLDQTSAHANHPAGHHIGTPRRSWVWLAVGLIVGGAAVGISVWPRINEVDFSNPLANATFSRITDFPGDELKASISPDGHFVAFASDRDGEFDVLVGQVGARNFRNVTNGEPVSTHPTIRSLGFNGDGSDIWFAGDDGGIRTTSILGGPFRNFLSEESISVDWSPDGRRIVYRLVTGGDHVYVADRDGANSRLILDAPDGYHQHFPTWSTDGEWIYMVRGWPTEQDLWRVRPDGSDLEQLTENLHGVLSPTPVDERTVLFVAQDQVGAGPWLWMFDAETGDSKRVSYGVEQYHSVAVSNDGRRVVAAVADPRENLWRLPILNRIATEADAAPVPLPSARARSPRHGTDALFYLSSRGSGDTLWKYHEDETEEIWSGTGAAILEEAPAVSPTGDEVALIVMENDHRRLVIVSSDGAQRRELPTEGIEVRHGLSWSPDGRWLVVSSSTKGNAGLYKLPLDGGVPVRIVEGEARRPVWSPRGDLIIYAGPQIGAEARLQAVRDDGTPVELPDIEVLFEQGGTRVRFLPDGRGIVYMQGTARLQDFHLLDLESMESRQLTRLENPAEMRTFDVSPDGSEIVFDRMNQNSDLVLIEFDNSTSK